MLILLFEKTIQVDILISTSLFLNKKKLAKKVLKLFVFYTVLKKVCLSREC